MVIVGSAETLANTILRLASERGLMGFAMILKPAAMPYDLVTRSISAFGKEVPPRTHGVLDCDVTANRAVAALALQSA
jgi:hypothetical protein